MVYTVVAITGPDNGSWQDYFKGLASQKQEIFDRLNVGSDQILIILVGSSETWGWNESVVENILACTACNGVAVGGTTPVVC